jgi:hypothetical protein
VIDSGELIVKLAAGSSPNITDVAFLEFATGDRDRRPALVRPLSGLMAVAIGLPAASALVVAAAIAHAQAIAINSNSRNAERTLSASTYDRRVPRTSSAAVAAPIERPIGGKCPRVSAC